MRVDAGVKLWERKYHLTAFNVILTGSNDIFYIFPLWNHIIVLSLSVGCHLCIPLVNQTKTINFFFFLLFSARLFWYLRSVAFMASQWRILVHWIRYFFPLPLRMNMQTRKFIISNTQHKRQVLFIYASNINTGKMFHFKQFFSLCLNDKKIFYFPADSNSSLRSIFSLAFIDLQLFWMNEKKKSTQLLLPIRLVLNSHWSMSLTNAHNCIVQ